ncbi:MAG TPA: DoxX family protein [Terracidiphilus sp.]|nr:DoxX family protein [Terracidiphilus sp.]
MTDLVRFLRSAYVRAAGMFDLLKSPLLLAIRLYWGWQFAQDGWGKLNHVEKVTAYFTTLSLPAPHLTAIFVGLVEFAGGILLALGLGSRLVSLVLLVNMTVAFWTAERDAFLGVISNPDKFQVADAYNYWFAALLILILGPGSLALDWVVARWADAEAKKKGPRMVDP